MRTIHPSPTAIHRVVSRLRAAVTACGGDQPAHMDVGIVHRQACRTAACHAGWYTLARFRHHPSVVWLYDNSLDDIGGETMMALGQCGNIRHLIHEHGAHVLARDLGFMTAPALKGWAERHPEIWGSPHGHRMFDPNGALAFAKHPNDTLLLTDIAAWWLAVAHRLDNAIPLHSTRNRALSILQRHGADARQTIRIERHTHKYRLVRHPYAVDLQAVLQV